MQRQAKSPNHAAPWTAIRVEMCLTKGTPGSIVLYPIKACQKMTSLERKIAVMITYGCSEGTAAGIPPGPAATPKHRRLMAAFVAWKAAELSLTRSSWLYAAG